MFQQGDLVVYGSTGVCRVKELAVRAAGQQTCYVLEPLYQTCTISIPVDSDKVSIRPVMSRREANELIDRIPEVEAEPFHCRSIQQLTEHYKAALNSHDCVGLVELTKSIYLKQQNALQQKRKLGTVDERFMKRAEDLLFGELAVALEIPPEEVERYISKRLSGR